MKKFYVVLLCLWGLTPFAFAQDFEEENIIPAHTDTNCPNPDDNCIVAADGNSYYEICNGTFVDRGLRAVPYFFGARNRNDFYKLQLSFKF